MERSIDEIVETVRRAKERERGCSLLIGAGCSVKAGIPAASGFVDVIRERYPFAYERAEPKTYARCMAQLMVSEQRDLIAEYVDKSKDQLGARVHGPPHALRVCRPHTHDQL